MNDRLRLPPIPSIATRVADPAAIAAAYRQADGVYEYIVAMTQPPAA